MAKCNQCAILRGVLGGVLSMTCALFIAYGRTVLSDTIYSVALGVVAVGLWFVSFVGLPRGKKCRFAMNQYMVGCGCLSCLGMTAIFGETASYYVLFQQSLDQPVVEVCDWGSWEEVGMAAYFSDATFEKDGIQGNTTVLHLKECYRKSTKNQKPWWVSCDVAVRPVFSCGAAPGSCRICAWAVKEGVPELPKPECPSDVSLCGISGDYDRAIKSCTESVCESSKNYFVEQLERLGSQYGMPKDSGDVPLLLLQSPQEVLQGNSWSWTGFWAAAAFNALLLCLEPFFPNSDVLEDSDSESDRNDFGEDDMDEDDSSNFRATKT
eukprot:TRINITY_DN85119_c0_g1_i1.p1 TRINITY_DN85119_c0_g1~~TRINITY_DN85119_c0_g1_i1.p1  ORF type:complete len:323 (+),score=8.79 TRINITY_DN85119_c0_g1_i1:156-1124(+)